MSGYRPSYTVDEGNKILQSIIDSQLYYALRGDAFWKDLSAVGHLDRTWMSLKRQFFRSILPDISNAQYKISELEASKIELACFQTSLKFKQDLKNLEENNISSNEDNDIEVDNPDSSSEDENGKVYKQQN